MNSPPIHFYLMLCLSAACARQNHHAATPSSPPRAQKIEAASGTASPEMPPLQVEATEAEKKEARLAIDEAKILYRDGQYELAEAKAKRAMELHPFLYEAPIILGKILLLRGAARHRSRDFDHARLMFEMANAMHPEDGEAKVLLELFGPQSQLEK